jgi:GNAT superfamily N-acetyltransferase
VSELRRIAETEYTQVLEIVNAAAEAYRGVIPADRWHDPYMSADELEREIAAGVVFWGTEDAEGRLAGVMGIQAVRDVDLIRHAYVRPGLQGGGIGRRLLEELTAKAERPLQVGTWAAATWAIRFYERNGFALVTPAEKDRLLNAYWAISERQVQTSVVLALRPVMDPGTAQGGAYTWPTRRTQRN